MTTVSDQIKPIEIAVVGGGISGATAALTLAEMGLNVTVFERNTSLVSGPPICHLHAGGNLYREISEQQCLTLLRQSIDTVKLFKHTLNIRPTVIAVPKSDPGEADAIIPRLKVVKASYQTLVDQDDSNEVLGDPSNYYRLYTKEQLLALQKKIQPANPESFDDWMIPFSQHANLEKLKYPVVAVQEYGWSVFRLSASANLALEQLSNCQLHLNTAVNEIEKIGAEWRIKFSQANGQQAESHFDYLINACGFETGVVDDWAQAPRQRLVEFKAAYVTQWAECNQEWPEVIFHGPRGTPQGMAQLTPYPNGTFQLHGMTEDITLFRDGLVSSSTHSSQPELPSLLHRKVKQGWTTAEFELRTNNAIEHMAQFIPDFAQALGEGKPLFGAQQIPGDNVTLRAADVSFSGESYARMEVVKGSSALDASNKIVDHMVNNGLIIKQDVLPMEYKITLSLAAKQVEKKAEDLARLRGYPVALAQIPKTN
ncbi:FAD-dependent oxidoreductase [Vibrio tapetis]|uniref:FAD dependent oxidoreductase domain-containing protein n=1 Tax=Vibrio tapetis subsp. tapetis TaxID=1671868 RepID=A0A2N8ZN60_9VIBR|nr:FAD-dependent oxidoreductase [Vibrio tapetis]SON53351.1 conserved protein of unknown function [Vibrio tapetis subsp. tapetis]